MEKPEMKMNQAIPEINVTSGGKQLGENVTTEILTPHSVKSADDKKTKPKENITTEKVTSADTSGDDKKTKPSKTAKTPNHPPMSEMVLDSIKSLKMRHGASVKAICKYIDDNYQADVGKLKRYMTRFFNDAVKKDILVKIGGTGEKTRFKLLKTGNAVKKARNPKDILKKDKTEKEVKSTENAKKIAREPKAVVEKEKNVKIGDVKKVGRSRKVAKISGKKEKRPNGRPRKQ